MLHLPSAASRLAPGEIDREEREGSNDDRSTGEITKELQRKRGKEEKKGKENGKKEKENKEEEKK
jgi:hypothetical protein